MKTFLLLYADDTLLFSETYEGMQNLLNISKNVSKSFIKTAKRKGDKFSLDGPLYCN
jgi:hypothetical protein